MNAIKTNEVSLQLDTFQLKDVSLSIPTGKITAIVGPNGSGKSTLLKIISKLVKAHDGSVYIFDKDSHFYKTKKFAQILSMLPQQNHALPNLTIKELISFGRSPYKPFLQQHLTEEDETIIDEAMELTNIRHHQDRLYFSLSGGEQQRARIAMALAQKTKILLLDEPTTYLDIAHQFEVLDLLQSINKKYQLTIVMVLHDLQQAVYYSDYMIAMKQGRMIAKGPSKKLLSDEFLQEVYDMNAEILYKDDYPLIIPKMRRK